MNKLQHLQYLGKLGNQGGRKPASGITDTDAQTYIAAVETADGQVLESGTRTAIQNFIVGAKADGIWDAIKAGAILAGARTLNGALVPLKGTAPTNFNFVSGNYNRKTGLVGDGSSKFLNSNRANNADGQNNQHLAVYLSTASSINSAHIGAGGTANGASSIGVSSTATLAFQRSRNNTASISGTLSVGFYGKTRSASGSYVNRCAGANTTVSSTSQTPTTGNLFVFARENNSGSAEIFLSDRLAFYSIGENLNLAKLDTRVTQLMTDLGNAIP